MSDNSTKTTEINIVSFPGFRDMEKSYSFRRRIAALWVDDQGKHRKFITTSNEDGSAWIELVEYLNNNFTNYRLNMSKYLPLNIDAFYESHPESKYASNEVVNWKSSYDEVTLKFLKITSPTDFPNEKDYRDYKLFTYNFDQLNNQQKNELLTQLSTVVSQGL